MAAVEANAAPTLPLPPRASAPTVGALLTRASAAAVTNSGASRDRDRDGSSPRSLLSRVFHRGGFGCRLRLPLPRRYFSSGAAAKENVVAAPKVVVVDSRAEPPPRESPRSSSLAGKDDALPASLGLGASLVLLLSKSAAELSRMAELRAQMERLMMDVRADVRSSSCNGRPSASSDGHTDDSANKEPIVVCAGGEDGSRTGVAASRGGSEDAGQIDTIDRMEAELEAELSRLQVASNDRQVEVVEAKMSGASSGSHSVISSDSDLEDAEKDQDDIDEEGQDEDEEEDECDGERNANSPPHGGVSARELERRLHELLQSQHEARIADLESSLERARRKLEEKEREACRWRDTAKLAARFTDESRFR